MAKAARQRLTIFTLYAVAMAYVESAVVVYLRKLYHPENILSMFPPRFMTELDFGIELGRETAIVVMILSLALLVDKRSWTRVFAAFVYIFGLWDLFYYVWLKLLIGWPVAWLEWDVLFLIAWIWLGPWICPALISLLFVVWGAWLLSAQRSYRLSSVGLGIFAGGAVLGVAAFLQPALPVLMRSGVEGMREYLPGNFWWVLFWPGYVLMIAGLVKGVTVEPEESAALPG